MARTPAEPKAETTAAPVPTVPAVTVIGPARGRWRAGRFFTPAPAILPLAELAEGQLEALKADPHLAVLEMEIAAAGVP